MDGKDHVHMNLFIGRRQVYKGLKTTLNKGLFWATINASAEGKSTEGKMNTDGSHLNKPVDEVVSKIAENPLRITFFPVYS